MFEAVDGVADAKTVGILLPNNEEEENVEGIGKETLPKRPRMDAASFSKEKAPSENWLAAMVAGENMVLKEILDELVELKKNSQEMLEERKKTNLILEKLVLAIENKFK
ncbi:uncharacterized protein LOC117788527 [Drosophila innubila]|uniref:uncharacterized protein LOC117788527 n=1 Tax=Drosophila innubila TaxID=198719 RepID=UPI00148C76C8|nr:uncharacterized protein LOC117788527 [Drosophila innubila]